MESRTITLLKEAGKRGLLLTELAQQLERPAKEILKVVESEDIDLLIMGTHGRKGLEHVFFGSVAENVVKKSPVPVLTINPYKLK